MNRAGDYLRLAAELAEVELDALTRGRGVVVVAPHPDDESLGCGGLIAACCAHGIEVRLLVLSDGTGSHPNSRRYPADRLRDLREAELEQATSILGLPAGPSPACVCRTVPCPARARISTAPSLRCRRLSGPSAPAACS
ncbi:MAG: PIG-L family deacetylase [Geminicoccaceae bacterium]